MKFDRLRRAAAMGLFLILSSCARASRSEMGDKIIFPNAFVSSNFTLQSSEADVRRAYPRAEIDKRKNITFFRLEPPHESTTTAKGHVEYRMEIYFANGKPWGSVIWISFVDKKDSVVLTPEEVEHIQNDLLANCASTYGIHTSTESYSQHGLGTTREFVWGKSRYKATLRLFHSKAPGVAIEDLGGLILTSINETPGERKRHLALSAVGGMP